MKKEDPCKKPEDFGEILFTFNLYYSGWECDNKAHVVRDAHGKHALVMSSHGYWGLAPPSALDGFLENYKTAIAETNKARELLRSDQRELLRQTP